MGVIPLNGKIVATPNGEEYFEDFPEGLTIPWGKIALQGKMISSNNCGGL
jgi:hypothetical protein